MQLIPSHSSQRFSLLLLLLFNLLACTSPTPRKVNEAIGRGQPKQAVRLLSDLINRDGEITTAKLDRLLKALSLNRRFNLSIADELFLRLKQDGKSAILKWYLNVYLERCEKALNKAQFEEARTLWKRHQRIRATAFPHFEESTPVLGIIDLREADYWLEKGKRAKARLYFESARKKLSRRVAFDQIQNFGFANLVQELRRKIYQSPPKKQKPVKKTPRRPLRKGKR
ncbi:hypothetical protein COW36_07035 [bacterium (Candidatus Blackallbacteria) CG17_big_fil_post_rev_8_21_14_2_50_48_46]|uniref:Uncharacterized protein n=1 Tax=bacterium (Candidatus Blackallbacteria) CG17_big_fil_post_rev_8_21_14_2_50_48_46 TaxID=2014261 RepID=A0A2M7G743_9BACT|nr:MAG: hypothetical protein COW64_06545 [bacterium (Candidatus Blackallbacteria) CG18_big_fil_WC_8_21_14_2_50_49_26]PIW17817.1 MAG: hypothetical protein COW36_07035 [bacterium (Candidatus Blackallbacteria) CG17_big_fil_post_rev_8_21_14_2_50_48_46]PIW48493.1 MAG: hypothetical protein COW20_08990 [bacterium (Candidatus Blackallbacteria) CG13_big_fil_rev_8_21_14_2_50_49_14]